jgi:hypothetical protein
MTTMTITKRFQAEAAKIKELHASIMGHARTTLKEAIECGELLMKVKNKCKHGEWLPWLKDNVPFDQKTAWNYMRCYDNRDDAKLGNVPNLTEAYRLMRGESTKPKPGGSGQRRSKQTRSTGNVARQNPPEPDKPIINAVIDITPDMLSMTAQQKLETAIRQHKQKLAAQYRLDVVAEAKEFLATTIGEQLRKEQKEARRIMESRKGIMKREAYRKILACLHPDRINQFITDPKLRQAYDEAWHLFRALEKLLLNEKESPTEFIGIPKTVAEWDALRRKTSEARKARRAGLART